MHLEIRHKINATNKDESATNSAWLVRREVAQHTVERSVGKITPNCRIRFDLIYCNEFLSYPPEAGAKNK